MSKLLAIGGRVLCKVLTKENMTEGGIVIPKSAKNDYDRAEVVSVGEDVTNEIEVGMTVLVAGYQGAALNGEFAGLKLFEEDQILGVIDDDEVG